MLPQPFFPARPINGGPLHLAREKPGSWIFEPKFNGWRALVHVPTLTCFNRHGELLSIDAEFALALAVLSRDLAIAQDRLACSEVHGRDRLIAQEVEWADCEGLDRRHDRGRGTLVILDLPRLNLPVEKRGLILRSIFCPAIDHCATRGAVYSAPQFTDGKTTYADLKETNKQLGCEFYEGVVAKRVGTLYPASPKATSETPFWVKHRWAW